jgi:hypothetical protein
MGLLEWEHRGPCEPCAGARRGVLCNEGLKPVMIDRHGHFPSRMASEVLSHWRRNNARVLARLEKQSLEKMLAHPDPRTLLAVIWIVDRRDLPRSWPVEPS